MSQLEQSMHVETPVLHTAKRIDGETPSLKISKDRDDLTSLLYIKSGRGECIIENVTYSVRQGDIVIGHPLVYFSVHSSSDQPLKAILFTFSCEVFGKIKGHLLDLGQCPVVPLGNHYSALSSYFETIVHEHEQSSIGSQEMVSGLMNAVIIILLRMLEAMKTPLLTSMIQNVRDYIDSHFEQELSVKELAQLVFVSPYHLIHMFKNEVGMAPIQYLIFCRMEEAKRLLQCTDLSNSEISIRIGYPNPNYFNQIFKKIVGLSPGKYRNDAKR